MNNNVNIKSGMQKNDRRFQKGISIFISLFFILTSVYAQRSISGTVIDEEGIPMTGVQITINNTSIGTITDMYGSYKLSDKSITNESVLIFRYLGMRTQEVLVGKQSLINVKMFEDSKDLNEVVVIGYGTMKKSDLTGSVGSVRMNEITKVPVLSYDQALSGRVAGVQVTSSDGQPGSGMDIIIRGGNSLTQTNAPLYVVDGFPLEEDMNADIDPENIESLTILKDASATAIYGARAANGVVVIETKKGQAGKPVITFNASYGNQQILKTMELMSPYEFVRYQLELDNSDATYRYLQDGKTLDSYLTTQGYNWQDRVFKPAPIQSYTLSVRGGKEDVRYAVSGSVNDQKGIIINSGFKSYRGSISLDLIDVVKNLNVSFNSILSQTTNYGQQPSSTSVGGLASSSLLYSVWGYRPVTGREDYTDLEDELIDPDIDTSNDYRVNPLMNLNNELRNNTSFLSKSGITLRYNFSKDLYLKVTGGINKRISRSDVFYNSSTTRGTPLIPSNSTRLTNGAVRYSESDSWTNENILVYKRKINKYHTLTTMIGSTLLGSKNQVYGLSAVMLPNEELGLSGLDEGLPSTVTAYNRESKMASFFSRVDYNYKSKYLLTGTIRADGSSKFAEGRRWGYFPSGAFAWRVSEEGFLEDIDFLSNLKMRFSYGLTGNNRVGDFAYLPSLNLPLDTKYSFNNESPSNGIIPTEMGNENLKWETTSQIDLGVDLGLFDNRIDLTVDLYKKITSDLLLYADLPYISGFTNVFNNIGKISNTGLEITLNTINIKSKNFTWETGFNISFNKNTILELVSDKMLSNIQWDNSFNNSPLYIAQIGGPAAQFYGYIFDGVYQFADFDLNESGKYVLKNDIPTNGNVRETIQPGDIRYKDIVGDDLIVNADDRTIIGNPFPIHIGGFSNNLKYKNFSLGVFFQWSYGNDVYNANRIVFEGNELSRIGLNQYSTYINRWSSENPSNILHRAGGHGPKGAYSSRVIEDGSYLRLKTLSLSYSLPDKLIKRMAFKDISINVSAQNVFTWTNYTGMDPEVSVRNSILTPGFDFSAYPRARTIMFGINASL